ncbi:MAG: DUF4329 domain-containing protein [Rhodobacteraceae bacterium]|nr:DUF4329 domain-containing protein [Paracoccaceae bacterium]
MRVSLPSPLKPIRVRLLGAALIAAVAAGMGGAAQAKDPQVAALARQVLSQLQARSIAAGREYCGMIGRTADGELVLGKVRKGRAGSCMPPRDPVGFFAVASFHTHGAYDPDYDNEVPSVNDVLSDMDEGTDGYVSTPGGRLWHVDRRTGRVVQLCGEGCLPMDPGHVPDPDLPVLRSYTLPALKAREERG